MAIELVSDNDLYETKRGKYTRNGKRGAYKHKGETKCFINPEHKTKVDSKDHQCWYKYKLNKDGKYDKSGKWDEQHYICSACYSGNGQNHPTLKRFDYKTRLDYANAGAKKLGFKDEAERYKTYRHETGRQIPMEDAKDGPQYFGICIGEKFVSQTFEGSKPASYGTPGYDWEWNNFKVQHKARCLNTLGIPQYWRFTRLDFNKIAQKFVLSGWDDRNSLKPLHIWIFDKDEIMSDGLPFWNRHDFKIYNTPEGLAEFAKYEDNDRLIRLKEIIDKDNRVLKT
jgi:hypothetical protein